MKEKEKKQKEDAVLKAITARERQQAQIRKQVLGAEDDTSPLQPFRIPRLPHYTPLAAAIQESRYRAVAKAGGRVVSGDMDVIVARALSGDLSLAGQSSVG